MRRQTPEHPVRDNRLWPRAGRRPRDGTTAARPLRRFDRRRAEGDRAGTHRGAGDAKRQAAAVRALGTIRRVASHECAGGLSLVGDRPGESKPRIHEQRARTAGNAGPLDVADRRRAGAGRVRGQASHVRKSARPFGAVEGRVQLADGIATDGTRALEVQAVRVNRPSEHSNPRRQENEANMNSLIRTLQQSLTIAAAACGGAGPSTRYVDMTHRIPAFDAISSESSLPDLAKPLDGSAAIPSFFPQAVFQTSTNPTNEGHFFRGRVSISEHHGTHVDAPSHYVNTQATTERGAVPARFQHDLTLDDLIGPIVYIDITPRVHAELARNGGAPSPKICHRPLDRDRGSQRDPHQRDRDRQHRCRRR